MLDYSQDSPHLGNQYEEDEGLKSYLFLLANNLPKEIQEDLSRFGDRVVSELILHHRNCERYPPQFDQYSAWGERIDQIHTHPSWAHMHKVSAEEHLIRLGYTDIEFNRIIQFTKLYLFNPSAGLYTCPLAMTDGAAYLIKHVLKKDSVIQNAFQHLISDKSQDFWTSGQWMTEKMGGSDVSAATQTVAELIQGDLYRLNGYKWFTSATTAQIAFTLGKVDGKVSLFFVDVVENKKNLAIVRLKDKMGTKQLPTAEIILKNCIGKLVSPIGEGIKYISNLMNITRLYNSICAVSSMRRALAIARDYADRRSVFGEKLSSHRLHKETLFSMEIKLRGNLLWVLYLSRLLEKVEKNRSLPWEQYTLRLMTPIVKLYTGKMSSEVVKEGMECIGGVAYMENSGFPNLLRDTEVYSIWEGTTNVLTLDMFRVLKSNNDLKLLKFKNSLLEITGNHEFDSRVDKVTTVIETGKNFRKVALEIGHVFVGALLRMAANKSGSETDRLIAEYWIGNFKETFLDYSDSLINQLALSIVDGKPTGVGDVDGLLKARYKL